MEQAISIQEVKHEKKFNLEKFVKYGLMVLGFGLFCVYLAQLYVSYDIDTKQVFPLGLTYFMFGLRWATIVMVGFAVVTPFFKGNTTKFILAILGPIVAVLNLVFLQENYKAWGPQTYTQWRAALFVIEQILVIIIGLSFLAELIVKKEFKKVKYYRIPLILIPMFLTFFYQPMLNILFGSYYNFHEGIMGAAKDVRPAADFNEIHIVSLVTNFLFILLGYIIMHKKTDDEKKIFFAMLACSGVFNFFYIKYGGVAGLPFHLCNAAIVMMFVAFIFNLKGIFYFTYFVNVLGALFAMLFPNITGTDAFALGSVRFWYNHIYAFVLPILGVALRVYPRPTLKMMLKAIGWFTVYFVLVAFMNAWLSNYDPGVDYFFINSDFFFDKLKIQNTALKDNYVLSFSFNGLIFEFYYLFYLAVYGVFIVLMFVLWYIYDFLFHTADNHYELHCKKKLVKQGYADLKKELAGRSPREPLYEELKKMIEIKNFTKIYSGSTTKAVDNLSLKVEDGTVYGFLGHNGAGKSTTIKSIVGIQTITSGQIIVDGYDVEKQSVEAKLRIGYVSDNHAVYERLTGREYINYIADLYMVNKEDRDARIEKYTKMFKLEDAIDREAKSYSHGMKQKLVIIASLIHDPKVWILDEPLTGLDPTSSFEIKECMKEHARRGNIVFFSSHVIEVVEKVCDHICIINHGRLMCQYSMKEIHDQGISLEQLYMKYLKVDDKKEEK